ncbi:MAG TPA: class I SAM-dependent methyltransferase [Burkholderiales bacterium]|nr:class I SAM-dependent methyltransferase [Burkholderiales bacterium]
MRGARASHSQGGFYGLLGRAWAYDALQNLLLRRGARERYVKEFVRPFPGCRILDIGCGTGSMLAHLPDTIGQYVGFDLNPRYIETARRRWGARGTFRCERLEAATLAQRDAYDIALANGILHHLDDDGARRLFELAHRALGPGGWLVTYDNVYVERQHWFARWLIGRDRGKAVRTREGYEALARARFPRIESAILHDTLRVPYTILVMRCIKSGEQ